VANEGKFAIFAAPEAAEAVVEVLRAVDERNRPATIGRVVAGDSARVVLEGPLGGSRILDLLSGEQLPRIC
jgi:hydrogenase expression/formation protein HypE